ncbi:MAG: ABC transporter permease [Rhodobacteraceae bacterium]|jgi:spermidine/putrescine transport system permease protein|nr:ABC transporter permease [Paracoccaceae bacterium]|tara:strand:- start:862 stop:1773 length:912 start_codon:yes stop_codon:yes gene_type:complete
MNSFYKKNGPVIATFFLVAIIFWLVFLIVIPQLYMLDLSFRPNLPPLLRGGADDVYTLSHYKHFLYGSETSKDAYNFVDIGVFLDTIITAILVTIINLCFCYPIAFYIAKLATPNTARLLVLALIIPFWINELLRSFAIRILFAGEGVINNILLELGLISTAVNFIALDIALYTGLTYAYILLMIFPLYNALETLDTNQLEAAKDLGSSTVRTHWRIVIPHAKAGIASGCTMVFMLTAGALATPVVLSSPNTYWFTQLIYQWFNMNDNWSRGSAYSIILLVVSVTFVLLMMRLFKVTIGEVVR